MLTERLKVVRCLRGVSRALEDAYGGGVGTTVGLLQNLVSRSLIDRNRVGRAGGLAALGEPEPQVAAKLLLFGGLSRLPRKLCLTVTQERLDECARVALAQDRTRGVTLDRPRVDRLGGAS